ncbi:MAG: AAA family ATPase [Candidatus Binatia bacterium]
MKIKQLQIANLRAFEQAEVDFRPGMNLLVGVNGVGKTTVLDSLRILLSKVLPEVTASRSRPLSFSMEDIRGNQEALTIKLQFELAETDFTFLVHKQSRLFIEHKAGVVREQTLGTPDQEECQPNLSTLAKSLKVAVEQPLGIFFSTSRSLVSDAVSPKGRTVGGQAAAFADALISHELRLAEMAYWLKAQEELGREQPVTLKHVAALRHATSRFLPECKNLRAETQPKPRLLIDKKKLTLDVRQLSDGERGLLALVLDLARRLSQANPALPDPVSKGRAVVLIDELDLHLHPKWQRTIVERLTRTFPCCQFIATTHSPQIVSAVEPEQVLLLTDQGVVRPDRTLGMDSNWILRHLMEADERPASAKKAIDSIEVLIKKGNFKKARAGIAEQRKKGLDLPEWSVLEARMARMEILAE